MAAIQNSTGVAAALRKAAQEPDLPALGQAAARLAAINEDLESLESLTEIALAEPGLAQKILRASQSASRGMGSSSRAPTLSRAIMALGVDQVRAMALALSVMGAASDRLDKGMAQAELSRALCAAFCAREIAADLGQEREGAALAALFLGCGQIFCALYEPELWARAKLAQKAQPLTWQQAFSQVSGMSEESFCQRLTQAWGIPDSALPMLREAAENPGKSPVRIAQQAALAFCHSDEAIAVSALVKALSALPGGKAALAQEGLGRGALIGARCGMPSPGPLHAKAARERGANPIQAAPGAMGSAPLGEEEPEVGAAPMPPALRLAIASGELAQQALDGVSGNALALQALEHLRDAFGMSQALCAFGKSAREASLRATLGANRIWALDFIEGRQKSKGDLFFHALARGVDAVAHDARALKAPLPLDLALRSDAPALSFAFFPLGSKGKPRGFIALSSPAAALTPFDADTLSGAKALCAQLALCLSMGRD